MYLFFYIFINQERKKLEEVINSIDYLNAKDRYSYTDKKYNPFNQLDDILDKCNGVTFPDLKVYCTHIMECLCSQISYSLSK